MSTYQLLPPLAPDEYEALKADIAARGIQVPVEVDEAGQILDGHHRVQAWQELHAEGQSLPEYPFVVREGWNEEQKRTHVRALNLNRRHLSREARRGLISEQLRETPERSNNQIAEGLGVSDHTVRAVRDDLEATSQIAKLEKTVGKDGKERPSSLPPRRYLADEDHRDIAEALLRKANPALMDAADRGVSKEEATALIDERIEELQAPATPRENRAADLPSVPPGELAMLESMRGHCQTVAMAIAKLAQSPISATEFKKYALAHTLQTARQNAPIVRALLDEIEGEDA
jgi:ParB-like chromosome segregation protein Spo0J